jgi:hypothetical protein
VSKSQHKTILASIILAGMDRLKDIKSKESLMVIWFFVSMLAWMAGLKVIEFLMSQVTTPKHPIAGFLVFSAFIGIFTGVTHYPFLRVINKIDGFHWILLTTISFALSGLLGTFAAGLLSGLPMIALQPLALKKLGKNLDVWITVTLGTHTLLGISLSVIVLLSAVAIENPFSPQILTLTGFIYALGTTIAFSSLYKQSQSLEI